MGKPTGIPYPRIAFREAVEGVLQDIRYALRTLRRDAGFTVFAVLIAGLGIGASATVFSLVNGVLLEPMPFRDPSRLVWISNIGDNGTDEWQLQVSNYLDLAARSRTLEDVAGYYAFYQIGNAPLAENGETRRLTGVPVTCNFFQFLGVTPLIGRSFAPGECVFGAPPTVMLTEALWRSRFAAKSDIVGKTININDTPVTVIGVVPASFDFPSVFSPGGAIEMFSTFSLGEANDRRGNTLAAIGRLKPGTTVASARTELVALGKEISDANPRRNSIRPRVMALDERVNGRVRPALFVLAAAVAAVMLIVCANLSSLQFARMSSRHRELAVRLALGASRARLVRQALTESLVLAGGGALLGVALAVVGTRLVSQLRAFDIPLLARVGVDGTALGVTLLVALVAGVVVGVLPALCSPGDVHDALKEGQRGSTRGRSRARGRAVLVNHENAAACVLLVTSGLLVRSFVHVLDVRLGYQPERAFTMRVDPPRRIPDLTEANGYYDAIVRRVRAMPGVTGAALGDLLPFGGDRSWGVAGEGQVYARDQYPQAFIRVVGTGWFGTMGIPLREGRDFGDGDSPDAARVVIVNETLAKTLWPGRDAIGQAIQRQSGLLRVVGVVGDVRHDALESAFTGELYFPMRETADYAAVNLVVRSTLAPAQLAASARAALESIAPDAARNEWRPLQQFVDKVLSPRRFLVMLLGGFTGFALLLAALGIYALISFGVTQRTNEIGIRMALGARARDVRGTIMRDTLALAVIGSVIGGVAAAAVAPSLRGMLFGVAWTDPASFAGAIAVLFVVALAAGWLPARRASQVDPMEALRES